MSNENDNDILNDLESFSEPENKKDKKEVIDKAGESTDKKSDKGTAKKTTAPVNPKTEMKTISKLKGANVIRKAEQVEKANVGDINTKTQFTLSDYKTSSESVIYFLKKYNKESYGKYTVRLCILCNNVCKYIFYSYWFYRLVSK